MKNQTDPKNHNWDNEWEKYNQAPYFKPNQKVISVITHLLNFDLTGKKILELGVGSGCDIVSLATMGARTYGLDFSPKSLQSVKYWAKNKKAKVNLIQADISQLKLPKNSFDIVYSVGLMEHFVDLIPLLKKQLDIVKLGGYLLIDIPQKYTLYTLAKHWRMNHGTHPFGWETEFSKSDLEQIATQLYQKPYLIYGRESDIIDKLSYYLGTNQLKNTFLAMIENSFLAPHVCLCIGLVIKKA